MSITSGYTRDALLLMNIVDYFTIESLTTYLGLTCVYVGVFVILLVVLGGMRLKTFFEQIHIYSVIDSLGVFLILIGTTIIGFLNIVSIKIIVLMILLFIASSASASFLANTVYLWGDDDR